ncbi:MAG TPA: hypothetical protein VLT36_06660 [Candidatus Dormibacteraeota bacterium]|nr:hypothetical protein [Candidatus Dormibacteraeota bacterium]
MKEKAQSEGQLGVMDFLKVIYDGQPEWSLLAVKASIEEVSEEFSDFRAANSVSRDVPRKPGKEYDDVAELVAIVQVKGNPWTIVYRSLLYVDESHIEAVAEEAKELSARLNTRAVTFVGEDTAGANGYKIFENGKLLEDAEWENGGDFFRFKSSLRKRPALESVEDEYVDGIFREEGIYLPACYPLSESGESWLAIEKSSLDAVERADLIELAEEDEDEEEGENEEE